MPQSQYKEHSSSDPNLNESGNIRKRKHVDEFSEHLKTFKSEILSSLNSWKSEIQKDISEIKSNLESVIRTDLANLNKLTQEMQAEICSIRQEYLDIKKSVQNFSVKQNETDKKLQQLENSAKYIGDQYDEITLKIGSITSKCQNLEELETKCSSLITNHKLLQQEFNLNNQRDRILNLEIVGVPERKKEDLSEIITNIAKRINITMLPEDVLFINRITPRTKQEGRPKNIIVKLKNRLLKENFISGARKCRLTTNDLGLPGNAKPIFINEHLTLHNKHILQKCREIAKLKQIQYVWTRNGRIYMRKNDTSPAILITEEDEITKKIF